MQQEEVVANDYKHELQEKWTRKRKDMELTREQNHRFKKLVSTIPAYTKALSFILYLLRASYYVRSTETNSYDSINRSKRKISSAQRTGRRLRKRRSRNRGPQLP